LQAARLNRANLSESHLHDADLQGADMEGANLLGARVYDQQIVRVSCLRGATMPDGSRYDGRFGLQGDIKRAYREQVDVNNTAMMAAFFGVTVEEYQHGQDWAQERLSRLYSEGL
jgi:uncharacterized protein YjbI with pentapeptide repeats